MANRRRIWLFRAVAVLLPFALVGALELAFRIAGAYEHGGWASPRIAIEPGEAFFPAWRDQLAIPKPPDTLRVFVLGGSSSMGLGAERPFATLLHERLSRLFPDRRVEVLNGGMVAFGSHRVYEVMREAAACDPDLFIVHIGHNEFLEEIFFDPEGLVATHQKLGEFARSLRVVNWVSTWTDEGIPIPKVQRHFLGNFNFPLIRSEEQYRLRLAFLEENVRRMIELARERGVGLVLAPAIPNLLSPPGDSVHGPSHEGREEEWDDLFESADAAYKGKRWDDARALFERLHAEVDDEYALSHYVSALARLAVEDQESALPELVRANRLDRRGDRSNTDVIERILATGEECGAAVVDLRRSIYPKVGEDYRTIRWGGGEPLFRDHCHPSTHGHEVIAEALLPVVLEELRRRR